jgi:tRNA 2-thiouridine synthesizing protein A
MPGGGWVTRLTRLLGAGSPARSPAPHPAGPPAHPGPAHPPPAPALVIDALGRKCPIPIIMLAQRIREVPVGQIVAVLADDPAAKSDIPAWCGIKSQEFVAATTLPSGWALLIRRCY